MNDSDRMPPHSKDAERAVLGSMIRDNLRIDDAGAVITADAFYLDAHQRIFRAAVELRATERPVDLVSLAERLQPVIADVGGYAYIGELWDAAPTAANFDHYLRIVRDKAKQRKVIHAANVILRDAYEPGDADELLASAERLILDVSQGNADQRAVSIAEAGREAFAALDAAKTGEIRSVPTGLHALDARMGGLRPGELVLVAARPGHGKTAIGLQIADSVAREDRALTLFVSLEMSRVELYNRLLSMHSGVPNFQIKQGHINDVEMGALIVSGDKIDRAVLEVDDWPYQTVSRLASSARRLKARRNLGLLVVDYLQLLDSETPKSPRHEQVQGMSRRLKLLAKELKIPVVVLAQLNRDTEHTVDHRPKVWQLRESGSLEQDADIVILLHRPELYDEFKNDPKMQGIAEVIIGKARHGPTGTVVLGFNKELMRFENKTECPL